MDREIIGQLSHWEKNTGERMFISLKSGHKCPTGSTTK